VSFDADGMGAFVKILDLFIRFLWSELVFVAGGGLLLAALISGALMSDLGVTGLFHPVVSSEDLGRCGQAGLPSECLKQIFVAPLQNPAFQAGALFAIFTGIVLVYWLERTINRNKALAIPVDERPRLGALVGTLLLAIAIPVSALIVWSPPAETGSIELGRMKLELFQFAFGALLAVGPGAVWLNVLLNSYARNTSSTRSWGAIALTALLAASLFAFFLQMQLSVDALLLLLSLVTALYILVRHYGWLALSRMRPVIGAAALLTALIVYVGVLQLNMWLPLAPNAVRPYRIAGIDRAADGAQVQGSPSGQCLDFRTGVRRTGGPRTAPLKSAAQANLIAPRDLLESRFRGVKSPAIVIVAASGGAYRATFWTATVLDSLIAESGSNQRFEGLADGIALLTGASGGVVALAYFAAGYERNWIGKTHALSSFIAKDIQSVTPPPSEDRERIDSLRSIANHLVSHDLRDVFLPRLCGEDRGRILERQWPALDKLNFAALAERDTRRMTATDMEPTGIAPQIIFQPMIVQSGEPLYITNLQMPVAATKRIALMEYLPGAQKELSLASAARLSATFPVITPSVDIPLPARRVDAVGQGFRVASGDELSANNATDVLVDGQLVDAGYFDNQGVDAAASFLLQDGVLEAIRQHSAKVFVIEIVAREASDDSQSDSFAALQILARPAAAYVSAAARGSIVRGNRTWELVKAKLGTGADGKNLFQRFTFTNRQARDVPMTWYIESAARRILQGQMRDNANEMSRLATAWQNK
jgi:hypothetical protein